MASAPARPVRFDPYKNFKFRLKWDGRVVAAASKMSALTGAAEIVVHRPGGEPSTGGKSPGRPQYEAIVLERGLTQDPAFQAWAGQVGTAGAAAPAVPSRQELLIEVYNAADGLVVGYQVFGCWVSEYQAQPDLDAGANAIAIEHLKLENEGWQRAGG